MTIRTRTAIIGLWTLTGLANQATAQREEGLTEQYPGEMAVYTEYKEHLILELDKGQLKARSEVKRDMLLLQDNATSFFNSATVYHSYFNRLESLKGSTLVPTAKDFKTIQAKLVKTRPSESESVFYDDGKETEVTFTHLAKGAHTVLEYTLDHQEIHMLPKFYFQSYLPVLHASFSITYPKGVAIEGIMQGAPVNWIRKSTEESRKTITVTWQADHVAKAKVFDNAPRFSYYAPHLVVFVKSYTDPKSGVTVPVLGNIEDLNRFLYGFVKNVNRKEDKDIAAGVATLTEGLGSDHEKAAAIYNWVQNHIRYVAFEDSLGGFIPREAATVYRRRFGDCKDMSSLLRAMCKAAGMDARYVWIGTRDIPYSFRTTPVTGAFNHMICAVKTEGRWTFLDGTDPILPYRAIPHALQGKEALISNSADSFEVVKLPVTGSEISRVSDSSFVQIKDQALTGEVSIHLNGYNAWDIRTLLKYRNDKEKEKAINAITSRGSNKYRQKEFEYNIPEDPLNAVAIHAGFEIPGYVRKAGKEYYINLNLQRDLSGSKIDITDRTAPVEKDYKETSSQVVVMDIPHGYTVSYLPEPREQSVDGIGAYRIRYQSDGKKVTLSKEIRLDALYIQPEHFNDFNKIVSGLQNAYKETVVLTAE